MSTWSYMTENARARAAGEMPAGSEPSVAPTDAPTLERLLAFEAANPRPGSAKNERIREELRITPARYFQLLGRLMHSDEAAQLDPITTHRLRRMEAERAAERARRVAR